MTRKLLRVPVDCLRVDGDDIADAEYVTEGDVYKRQAVVTSVEEAKQTLVEKGGAA